MPTFLPYLNFQGTCREAFERYHEIFGGDLVMMKMSEMPGDQPVPAEQADLIMHAALKFDDGGLLMASDAPPELAEPMQGLAVNCSVPDVAEAERVFAALADGGRVTMPLEEVFWSPRFGMCVDRFGTPWMVNVEAPAES